MSLVDQFESVFRSADRRRYEYTRVDMERVLVVTDLADGEAGELTDALKKYLVEVEEEGGVTWTTLGNDDYGDVDALLEKVEEVDAQPARAAEPELVGRRDGDGIEGLLTNVGGLLTLISSVPNIIVGQTAGISFIDFFVVAAPYVVIATALTIVSGAWLFGIRRLATPAERSAAAELVATSTKTRASRAAGSSPTAR